MLFEGDFAPPAGRFAIVAARFNAVVVDQLVLGACDALARHGVAAERVDVARVPGAFELPLVAQRMARTGNYAAVICLGAVIRGDTTHYDHVVSGATSGIARAALDTGIPVIFGVVTCENFDQAINRAGGKSGNKGADAAMAAIEMVNLLAKLG